MAHLPVDRRAPGAAVAFRRAVVHVQNDITLLHQQVVEHLFAEIIRIAVADVLQVAGAVHEHHHWILLARLQLRRAIQLRPDGSGALARRHLHHLRNDPAARTELRRTRVGQFQRVAAGARHHGQLRRQVAGRIVQQYFLIVRRQLEALHAVERGKLAHLAARCRCRTHFVVTRPFAIADEIRGAAIRRPLYR